MLFKQQIDSAQFTKFEDDSNECEEHDTMNSLDTINFTFVLDCYHFSAKGVVTISPQVSLYLSLCHHFVLW
jgi:hypothetical protein